MRLDFRRETGGFFLPGRFAIPARRGLILRLFRKARGLGGLRLTADGQSKLALKLLEPRGKLGIIKSRHAVLPEVDEPGDALPARLVEVPEENRDGGVDPVRGATLRPGDLQMGPEYDREREDLPGFR